jgi:hypothetical protein
MKKAIYLILIVSLGLTVRTAKATSVIPPTFDELVDQAEVIFEGNVTDVRSQWVGEGAQRHIVSYVSFKVEDAVKGSPGQTYTVRMLGGTVDGESMVISDAPRFQVGDRDIIFVQNNGSQFIPLVGIMHGRFHVKRDQNGRDIVTTNSGEPLRDVAKLGREEQADSAREALTPQAFKAAVQTQLDNRPVQ